MRNVSLQTTKHSKKDFESQKEETSVAGVVQWIGHLALVSKIVTKIITCKLDPH